MVGQDLEDQLSLLQDNADKLTGKITPYVMEQILQEKLALANKQYDTYILESETDLNAADKEINILERQLEQERI